MHRTAAGWSFVKQTVSRRSQVSAADLIIDFDRLAHAGIRKVLFDPFAIRLVRQLLADLREMVLTIRILNGCQQFGPLAHEMTAPT